MISKFGDFRDKLFKLEENEGKSKVLDLGEAIRRYVKPGMKVHISDRANAAASELIRQFHETKPHFTLIAMVVSEQVSNLVHCGLVEKAITSTCTEIYPTPGPNKVIQRALRDKALELENWSLLSLCQRLMAGALDLPFMPTKSLSGSNLAGENHSSFHEISDPFGSSTKIGIVKALNPDISLIHGWAADPSGNVIAAPYPVSGEDGWGAKASQTGVLVTVEHIVSSQFIREHPTMVTIPSCIVNSVSLVPMGAHPWSMATNFGISEFKPYRDDFEFINERRQASRNSEDLDLWIKNWVLDCPDHNSYLSKLGEERILTLKKQATLDSWKDNPALDAISHSPSYNPREMMVVAAARRLEELVLDKGYKGVLFGTGTSCLVGYLTYYKLKQRDLDIELWLGGTGCYGISPRPSSSIYPIYCDPPSVSTSKMITDVVDIYGVFFGGKQRNSIAILSTAQVDKYGNLNSTRISADSFLIGSGGGNDAANGKEILLMLPQSRDKLVDNVYYVTCPGAKVRTLVTDRGIFQKQDEEFVLTNYFPAPTITSPREAISQIRETCGWELKISPQVTEISPPSLEELILLRTFDPQGYFTKVD